MANHSQTWVKHRNPLLRIISPPNGADEGEQNLNALEGFLLPNGMWNQWLWGNFVRFEMPWPGALQLFDKTEISSQSFLLHFFPFFAILHCMLGHLVPLWEGDGVSLHEVRWIRKAASNKVCSHRGSVGEVQDVQFHESPLPERVRYEKCLCATYCSVQLITGWKNQGPGYSPKDTDVWLFNSFGQTGALVESGLPVWSQVQINTQSTRVICHPESHMEFKWQPLILRRQHLSSGSSLLKPWLMLI